MSWAGRGPPADSRWSTWHRRAVRYGGVGGLCAGHIVLAEANPNTNNLVANLEIISCEGNPSAVFASIVGRRMSFKGDAQSSNKPRQPAHHRHELLMVEKEIEPDRQRDHPEKKLSHIGYLPISNCRQTPHGLSNKKVFGPRSIYSEMPRYKIRMMSATRIPIITAAASCAGW